MSSGTMGDAACSRCGRRAPVVFEGVVAKCSACGAPRNPLTARAVHVTGKARQVSGTVARALGWFVIAGGVLAALLAGLALQLIFPAGYAGWIVGAIVLFFTALAGATLIVGGGALRRHGDEVARDTLNKALYALAEQRGGALTVDEVASTLDLPPAAADAVLTELAKQPDAHVSLEVKDDGTLVYTFPTTPSAAKREGRRVRIAEPAEPAIVDAELIDAEADRPVRRTTT